MEKMSENKEGKRKHSFPSSYDNIPNEVERKLNHSRAAEISSVQSDLKSD